MKTSNIRFLILVLLSGGAIGYICGVAPKIAENYTQAHVNTGYQWLINDWPPESNLMISEPIPFSGYGEELEQLKHNVGMWNVHSYHTTSSFIDILSASPKALACCEMPEIGEEVRFLSADPYNVESLDVVVRKNGDVIIAKATIHIPAMAW